MLWALITLGALQVGAPQDSVTLTLDEAARRAALTSPSVATAAGEIRRAQGLRAEAGLPFASNPEVTFNRTRRRSTGETFDHEWTVAQEFEIAGQWSLRRNAASALLLANEARVDDARLRASLAARQAYVFLVLAERGQLLVDSTAAYAERLAEFARLQFEAGELNRLQLNAAILEGARARSTADLVAADRAAAAAELARVLGVPADSAIRTVALPDVPQLRWVSEGALLAIAEEHRPDLRAAREDSRAAQDASALASRSLVPNLVLSVNGGEEAGTDDLLGLGIGMSIPLFYQRQAVKGASSADLAVAQGQLVETTRGVQAELRAQAARFTRSAQAEQRFARDVLAAAGENVSLTERALREGEVDLTDVIVYRRTAVDAQLEYLDVLLAQYFAWFNLAAALGVDPNDLPSLLSGTEN